MSEEKTKEHRCIDCGVIIAGHGNRLRCKACKVIADRKYRAAWAEKNRERSAAKHRDLRIQRRESTPPPVCKRCGKEYVRVSGFQKYCPDCRVRLQEERRIKPIKPRKKRLTLSQVEKIAREHGMSYGYAVAAGLDKIKR